MVSRSIKLIYLFSIFSLVFNTNAIAIWQIDTIDNTCGVNTSLKIDKKDYPHIAYGTGSPTYDIKYAYWTGSNWYVEIVDSASKVGGYIPISLALDSNDNPHISYFNSLSGTSGELKYAKCNGTLWTISTVDTGFDFCSIAIDNNGFPHIAYQSMEMNSVLKYARLSETGWNIQTVDNSYAGAFPSIAIDTNNFPHICYLNRASLDCLKYARLSETGWNIQTVDIAQGKRFGYFNSISLDSNNFPNISYCENVTGSVKYAKWDGNSWLTTTIESLNQSSAFSYTSIVIDSRGYPYISYRDSINKKIKISKWLGTEWFVDQVIDPSPTSGSYLPSMDIDENDNICISYMGTDGTRYYTKLARIINSAPILSWTNEINYTSDGLNPEIGDSSTSFTYRVMYTDADNDAPESGYPKVHIKKNNIEISGSPFTMNYVSGNYNTGAIYSYSVSLDLGNYYTYYFEAFDGQGATATGVATTEINAPDVVFIDRMVPSSINNLDVTIINITSMTLTWTAPGNDGNIGNITNGQYYLKYSTNNVISGDVISWWNNAENEIKWSANITPGSDEIKTVTGLNSSTKYYFSIKTADESQNWSECSNILFSETLTTPIPTFLTKFGGYGQNGLGPRYFDTPEGFVVDKLENVFVSDSWSIIEKFDGIGNSLYEWGPDHDVFWDRNSMACDSLGYLYTAGDQYIKKFGSNGKVLLKWPLSRSVYTKINGIAIDKNDILYLTSTIYDYRYPLYCESEIIKFTTSGTFLQARTYPLTEFMGLRVDNDGNIYVADYRNHQIQKYDLFGNLINQWGCYGDKDGQFKYPTDIGIDSKNNVLVVDGGMRWPNGPSFGNHRIQKFTTNGEFITKWGSFGTGDGQFTYPISIGITSNDNIYILERGQGILTEGGLERVQLFKENVSPEKPIVDWISHGKGNNSDILRDFTIKGFNFQTGATVKLSRQGESDINVTDVMVENSNEIKCNIDLRNATIGYWNVNVTNPNGQLETFPNCLEVIIASPKNILIWGGWAYPESQTTFRRPQRIAIDKWGFVYVTDAHISLSSGRYESQKVKKYDSSGNFIIEWDNVAENPVGIAVDTLGNFFVADNNNNRVDKYDSQGNFIRQWTVNNPVDLAIDVSDNIFVINAINNKIEKYNSNGNYIDSWGLEGSGQGQFKNPGGLGIDSLGNVYVADTQNHRIQKFTNNGIFVTQWGIYGNGRGQFMYPTDIAIDSNGNAFVTDTGILENIIDQTGSWYRQYGNQRVQQFDANGNYISEWNGFTFPQSIAVDTYGSNALYALEKATLVRYVQQYPGEMFIGCNIYKYCPFIPEVIVPSAVNNITITKVTLNSINISWVAPGYNGNTGNINDGKYCIRYSSFQSMNPFYDLTWSTNTNPGNIENKEIGELFSGTNYYFQIKTANGLSNWSEWSNIKIARTLFISTSTDNNVSLISDISVDFTIVPNTDADISLALLQAKEQGLHLISNIYDLKPTGTIFSSPAKIIFRYDPSKVTDITKLAIYKWDGTQWLSSLIIDQIVYEGENPNVQGYLSSLSYYGLFILDTVPPHITLINPTGGERFVINTSYITISFAVTDNLDPAPTYYAFLTNLERSTTIQVYNEQEINPLSIDAGFWTLTVVATDWVGNSISSTTGKFEIIHDMQPPRITISISEPKYITQLSTYVSVQTQFTLIAIDDLINIGDGKGFGVKEIKYRIDEGDWQVYTGTFTIPIESSHTITYYSIDVIGNTEQAKELEIIVDTIPPETSVSMSQPKYENYITSQTKIDIIAIDPSIPLGTSSGTIPSGVKRTNYSINNLEFMQYTSTFNITGDDGIYTIKYYSVDNVENTEVVKSTTVKLDNTPPVTIISIDYPKYINGEKTWITSTTPIRLNAVDDGCGVSIRNYKIDETDWQIYTSSFIIGTEGEHTIYYCSKDNLNNIEQIKSKTVIIDNTSPNTEISVSSPKYTFDNKLWVSSETIISLTAIDAPTVSCGVKYIEYKIDDGSYNIYIQQIELSTLSEGEHTITYRSYDNLSNQEQEKSLKLIIDNSAPETFVSISEPKYIEYFTSDSQIKLIAIDSGTIPSGIKETKYTIYISTDNIPAYTQYTTTFNITGVDGVYSMNYYSQDNVDNIEPERTITIKLDNTKPESQLSLDGIKYIANGKTYINLQTKIVLTAIDPINNNVTSGLKEIRFKIDNSEYITYNSPFTLPEGIHIVKHYSLDNLGNKELIKEQTFYVDGTLPITQLIIGDPQYQAFGRTVISPLTPLRLTATDPITANVASGVKYTEYRIDGGTYTVYSTTFTLTEGIHLVEYRSIDNVENTEVLKANTFTVTYLSEYAVFGKDGVTINGQGKVYGDVRSNSQIMLNGQALIDGNAEGQTVILTGQSQVKKKITQNVPAINPYVVDLVTIQVQVSQNNDNSNIPLTTKGKKAIINGVLTLSGQDSITITTGTYYLAGISVSGQTKLYFNGIVRIFCTGNINVSGQSEIHYSGNPYNCIIRSKVSTQSAVMVST